MTRSAFVINVTGQVQGVGFRAFIRRTALGLGLDGWVRNLSDGSVEIMVIGEAHLIDQLVEASNVGPPAARPEQISVRGAEDDGSQGFVERATARID